MGDGKMISVNEHALDVFEEMMDFADELKVGVEELANGTTIIDAGVNEPGGFEAGLYLARICMADLADIRFTSVALKGRAFPAIQVTTDFPILSCMASQYAGWQIKVEKFFAMGSGPARALAKKPKKLYEEIGYEDVAEEAVLVLEGRQIPDENVAEKIAQECDVRPEDLYIAIAPTASVAGSVQISARVVETGIHKLESIGFDINKIKHGHGVAPIAPIVGDDVKCMGSTNDCIIYCGRTFYVVEYENLDELKEFLKKAPSETSSSYGKPFYVTFKEAGFDFYKVDAGVFAPAEITINEIKSGKTFSCGRINEDVLLQSFGLEMI
ncbi:MAG: Methenyltetrahydromethanopterin cyclohydrolase [Candidatus Alkanophagales archaeon MCA70_species_2]|nr:Methenyltetrahydromethanopterin cyclohydrolase [Candidatus Alkanophaga liquidiphilum]